MTKKRLIFSLLIVSTLLFNCTTDNNSAESADKQILPIPEDIEKSQGAASIKDETEELIKYPIIHSSQENTVLYADILSVAENMTINERLRSLGVVDLFSINTNAFEILTYPQMEINDIDISDDLLVVGGRGVSILNRKENLWNYYIYPDSDIGNMVKYVNIDKKDVYINTYGTGDDFGRPGIFLKPYSSIWSEYSNSNDTLVGSSLSYKAFYKISGEYQVYWYTGLDNIYYTKDNGQLWNQLVLPDYIKSVLKPVMTKSFNMTLFNNKLIIQISDNNGKYSDVFLVDLDTMNIKHLHTPEKGKLSISWNLKPLNAKMNEDFIIWLSFDENYRYVVNIYSDEGIRQYSTRAGSGNYLDFDILNNKIVYVVKNKIIEIDPYTLNTRLIVESTEQITNISANGGELAIATDSSISIIDINTGHIESFYFDPIVPTMPGMYPFYIENDILQIGGISYNFLNDKWQSSPSVRKRGDKKYNTSDDEIMNRLGHLNIYDIAIAGNRVFYIPSKGENRLKLIMKNRVTGNETLLLNEYIHNIEIYKEKIFATGRSSIYFFNFDLD